MPPELVGEDSAQDALVDRVHRTLLAAASPNDVGRRTIEHLVRDEAPLLGRPRFDAVVDRVLARTRGLGPLEPVLADPTVSEVMVNPSGEVWIERDGRLSRLDLHIEAATTEHLIERIVAPLGLRIDRSSALVDARLPDGSRVNAVVPPLAVDGPCLTIRRFAARLVDLDQVCPPGVAPLLRWAVAARANVVIAGGAGAGKTTLLNALAVQVPTGERVITIEDTAELHLPVPHVIRLEARPANAEGVGEVTLRRLLRNALRMRPDRIIVGEVRGPEAIEMVHAMSTGHEGSLSTCHANGPADAMRRLETMALMADLGLPHTAVREQLVAAVDLVVHVARRPDGRRAVVDVAEVAALDAGRRGPPVELRSLVGERGLERLPTRPVRHPTAPPSSPDWIAS